MHDTSDIGEQLAGDPWLKKQCETWEKTKNRSLLIDWLSTLNLNEMKCFGPLYCKPSKHVTFKHVLTWASAASLTDCVEILSRVFASLYVKPIVMAIQKHSWLIMCYCGQNMSDHDIRGQLDESLMSFSSIGWIPSTAKTTMFEGAFFSQVKSYI